MRGLAAAGASILVAGILLCAGLGAPAGADSGDGGFVSGPAGPGGIDVTDPSSGGFVHGSLIDAKGDVIGDLTVIDDGEFAAWIINADGAPAGLHALQVHDAGLCQAPFTTAGSPITSIALPPISVASDGTGLAFFLTPTAEVAHLADDDGLSLVMSDHTDNRANIPTRYQASGYAVPGPDDITKATGDVGRPIGCAVAHVDTGKSRSRGRVDAARSLALETERAQARLADPTDITIASLRGGDGTDSGTISIAAAPGGQAFVSVRVRDLTPGVHGLQLHTAGRCTGSTFASAGPRLGSVDLPDLVVGPDGTADAAFSTPMPALASLLAGDGTSVVVQAGADNHRNIPDRYTSSGAAGPGPDAITLASGDAGANATCGRLRSVPLIERYIDAIYEQVVNRPATPAEVRKWTGALATGPRAGFVDRLSRGTEARAVLVASIYDSVLGQQPSSAALRDWVTRLGRPGVSETTLTADLLASATVFTGLGGTNEDFVTGAFEYALGRDPSEAEGTIWIAFLDRGGVRSTLAESLLRGTEARTEEIVGDYEDLLGVDPEPDQTDAWLTFFRRGGDSRDLRTFLLGSQAYYEVITNPDSFGG